jgi:hypothetical protein
VERSVILLLPPQFVTPLVQIKEALEIHKLTKFEEVEPKAGCRRFRLF